MKYVARILILAFVVIQFWRPERTNPPTDGALEAPSEVMAVLEQSCFDCHSHETKWPWYSAVAPASWLVARDVEEAREHLNFSTWLRYSSTERTKLREEIWEEVEEGEMPLKIYLPAHPDARLTEADRETLRKWATGG